MNRILHRFSLILLVCLTTFASGYTQKKLLILGSSTSACWGPTNPANCYVNRLANYYNIPTPMITIENRAAGGFNVYKSMPRGYKPPPGRDTSLPYYSITDALLANPDVILVNYPSNNYDLYSVAEVMFCLRTIKAEANKAGKPCYITTTQPRTSFDAASREKLRILKDSILYQFGPSAIDFWTGIADPVTLAIAAPYEVAGDPVHLNDEAHNVLFQRVVGRNIFNSALPDAGPDQNITLPSSVFLDGRNSVAAGTIVSYSWTKVSGPASANLVTPNSSSTYLNSLTGGVYTFRLTVKDDRGNIASDDVVINARDGSGASAPTAQAGPDLTINLPVNSVTLDGSKSTAPGSIITKFNWSYVSGPSSYYIATPIAVGTEIKNLVQGVYTFRLMVTNALGQTAYDDIVITVNPAPATQPPIANAGKDETITVGQATVLHGENSTAPGGYIKSYSWSKISGPDTYEILTPSASSSWIRNMVAGTYVFRLTVTDNNGLSAFDDVVITVTSIVNAPLPSDPPVAQAGRDISITLPVSSVTLDASASTAPGSYITKYNWSYVSGPAGSYIVTPIAVTTEIKNLVQGVYTFRLTVTNSAGLSASDDVMITVNGAITSQPPVANAGKDETITVGQATVLHGENSTAPGGYIKTYSWSKVSGPETYEILTPSASSTWIRNMVAGTYVYRLTVTDNNGASAFDDVTITVTSILAAPIPSDFPVAQAGPDVTITFPVSSVILDASASTAPGSFITKYNWSYVSGPAAYYITTPIAVTTEIKNLVQGVYTFRLTVTNNAGKSSSDDIVITVKPAMSNAPVAIAGKDETLPAGQATVLHGENSYALAGYIRSYSWSKISGPDTYEILSPTASYTWIRNMVPGVYVFRLTVTDNYGATGIDDVVITVTGSTTTIANAGKDEIIPTGQATVLHGEYSSCTGGQIVSYLWTKISGPSSYEILTPAAATTWIRNMVAGSYVYRLTVTDDKGNKSVDDVVITVSASYTMLNRRKQNQLSINNRADLLNQVGFHIYPNPAMNHLSIELNQATTGHGKIYVIDAAGSRVKQVSFVKDQQVFSKQLDLTGLKQGTYTVELWIKNQQTVVGKFFKY